MSTPVASGPGALSRRTDTGPTQKLRDLPDADYGENATYKDLQQSAGLSQSAGGDIGQMSGTNPAAANVTPINAPSTMPGTPVTDGATAGAGAGIDALGLANQQNEDLMRLVPYLPVLEFMSNQDGASWAMRNLVRKVKANL